MIPQQYQWLEKEPGPRMLVEALKLYGVTEVAGEENNPEILGWANELGLMAYNADAIPWCGLFMAYVAMKAGKKVPTAPLWARNWMRFGEPCQPELGAVLTFSRGTGGHVGLYVGEDKMGFYHVLGGNQGDAVSFTRIAKERLLSSRAMYKKKPANIRRVILSPDGEVSTNEA
jgi:uncharacterized protein (TIGR02594 family)